MEAVFQWQYHNLVILRFTSSDLICLFTQYLPTIIKEALCA